MKLLNERSALIDMQSYFRERVFVFTHVEKTGGSSFVVGLRGILGNEHVHDIRGQVPAPAEMQPKELRNIWALSGHFWFDTQERPISRRKRYFMCVRDPVDRFLSHYNYVAASPSHPGHTKYGVLNIQDAYQYLRKHNLNSVSNRFCAMFGDRSVGKPREPGRVIRSRRPVSFEQAYEKIALNYALAIPMLRLNDALDKLSETFGAPRPSSEKVNVALKKTATHVPDAIRKDIVARNVEDYKLLARIEAVFDDHLRDLSARLHAH